MLRLKYLFFSSAFAFSLVACSDDESGTTISTEGSTDNDIIFDTSSSSHESKDPAATDKESNSPTDKYSSNSSMEYQSSFSKEEETETASLMVENSYEDLLKQKCDSTKSGELVYVSDSSKIYFCDGDEWRALGTDYSKENVSYDANPTMREVVPIKINEMRVTPNQDQSVFAISGGAFFDLQDMPVLPAGAELYFVNLDIFIAKKKNGQLIQTPLTVTCNGEPCALTTPIQTINLTEMNAQIKDFDKSDCGDFRIDVSYSATYDASVPNMFVARNSVEFSRDEVYCEETKEEIIVPKGSNVVLTSYEVTLNTKKSEGLSLSTGKVVPVEDADIYFTSDDFTAEISVNTQNGAKIAPYSNDIDNNYEDDWNIKNLPPTPTHMSDFQYSETHLGNSISNFDTFVFYVVKTPDFDEETGEGFFAFTTKKVSEQEGDKNIKVTLLVYKK